MNSNPERPSHTRGNHFVWHALQVWCALMTTLLLASDAHAQATNVFTNQTTGFWTAAGSWVGGNMPVVGGSNDYIIIFNNTATDWSTNNRAS
ncbi:MAG: hypothetical protein WA117_18945, partial [Verrucomicrobiia bacterium]